MRPQFTPKVCSIDSCERPSLHLGWCSIHYERWRRNGDPLKTIHPPRIMGTQEDRFWAKVNKDGPVPDARPDLGPCWLWIAAIRKDGYAGFRFDGKQTCAHLFLVGRAPAGLEWDHLCRVRHCVRPTHLEAVTHQENVRRSTIGEWQSNKTHCINGHPFDETNTVIHKGGYRRCRECHRIEKQRKRLKEKLSA